MATLLQPLSPRFAAKNSRSAQNYARVNSHSLQNTEEEPMTNTPQQHPLHTRRTFHCRFTRKNRKFRARPPIKMRPMQHPYSYYSVLQHHVAHSHISTHMAIEHGNIDAAITMRSGAKDSRSTKNYANMVMRCEFTRRPSSQCIVMWCKVTHCPSVQCIGMRCKLLCDVKSRTASHCAVLLCGVSHAPPFIAV